MLRWVRPWNATILSVCVLAGAWGCSRSARTPDAAGKEPVADRAVAPAPSSERSLYEQCRSGSVQLAGVEEEIEAALRRTEAMKSRAPAELARALSETAELLDSAGASIADFSEEPPPFEQFRRSLLEHDDRRLKAIESANDALFDLQSASGVLAGLEDSGPHSKGVQSLLDQIAVAIDDLSEAIESLGGQVDAPV